MASTKGTGLAHYPVPSLTSFETKYSLFGNSDRTSLWMTIYAKTVEAYLKELPEDRGIATSAVHQVILGHVPKR